MLERLAELSIGLAAAIGVLWIFLQMIKEWRKGPAPEKNGNGNGKKRAGDVDPEVWEARIREIVRSENENLLGDIRLLLESRTGVLVKEIREPIMLNVDNTRHGFGNAMQRVISAIYEGRRRETEM